MDKKVIAAVICVVVVGAALGAYFIATPAPQIEQKQSEITVTDLAGRAVTIDKPVERVVLASYNIILETIAVEGGKDPFKEIVGLDKGWKHDRAQFWEKYKRAFPEIEDIADVGSIYKGTFNVEKVIALKPDVVIASGYSHEKWKNICEKLEKAGIPVVFLDYMPQTIEGHTQSTLLLGKVLGKEERAQEIMDFYMERVNEVYSRIEEIDNPKPKVYVECGSKGPSTYGNTYGNYIWGALIENCGGINIADGVIERYGSINPEYLLDANPDVIIITGSNWPANPSSMKLGYYANHEESEELLKAYLNRPGWDALNAVKNHRVHSVHHTLARHIHDFVSVQYIAKCLYPDEFEDIYPEEYWKEYHRRFLPVDYSGVWMMSLEEEKS